MTTRLADERDTSEGLWFQGEDAGVSGRHSDILHGARCIPALLDACACTLFWGMEIMSYLFALLRFHTSGRFPAGTLELQQVK